MLMLASVMTIMSGHMAVSLKTVYITEGCLFFGLEQHLSCPDTHTHTHHMITLMRSMWLACMVLLHLLESVKFGYSYCMQSLQIHYVSVT